MNDHSQENRRVDILIVEDSPTQAEELKYTLERHNFDVSVARNGVEALASIRARRPSMVITDIVMPEMDGYQLCREIKQDDGLNNIPVILLTSLSNPRDVVRGLECGADNFLTKPYDERYILSRIQYIIANRNLREIEQTQLGVEIVLDNERYFIKSDRIQILNLLLSSYETAIQKNGELLRAQRDLKSLNEQLEQKVDARTASLKEEIAERNRAEAVIRKSKEEWERTFDAITDPIMILDNDYRIVKSNKALADILKMTPAETEGGICCRMAHGTEEPHADCPHTRLMADGMSHATEIDEPRLGGSFLVSVSPIFDQENKLVGSVHYARDITERKKLEEQLLQSQKMEVVGQLSGGIAHDLNNILTSIIGFATLVDMRMNESDPQKEHLGHVLAAADRAAELTKSLMAFSRKQIINPQPVDLNQIIAKTEKFMRRIIPEDIEVRTSFKKDALVINADAGQIEQVLMNLGANARDAMPNGGFLSREADPVDMPGGGLLSIETDTVAMDDDFVKAHGFGEPGVYALLTFSDNGVGMDAEIRKRVFEPFFTTKEVGKGTGLGLSIVYGIIKQHKGFITVYSEPGAGTTFRVYLPLIHAAVVTSLNTMSETPALGDETILVADDDFQLRELMKLTLNEFGYSVIIANDGIDALERFRENRDSIKLVIMDVIMPKMNGKEVYDEIRKIAPAVKAIFMSGYTNDIIHGQGILDQRLEFIPKPMNPRQLLVKVRTVLDGGTDGTDK
ncbi:MAG: response regulator [Desulfobacteraceae bacterium]|nr:response regulator [Desulfobacteraceae bacterium]